MVGPIPQSLLRIAVALVLLVAVNSAILVDWLPDASAGPLQVPHQATLSVSMVDNAFQPPSITIQLGDTITWKNNGAFAHTSTSDVPGLWDSGFLNPGQSFSQAFNTVGTFSYYCAINAAQGMVGTVIVVTAADLTATATTTATPTTTIATLTPTPTPTSTAITATGTPTAPSTSVRPTILISIVDYRFMPQNLSVGVGSRIIWTNNGAFPHTLTSDADLWESVTLSQSQTSSRTFDAPGSYFYHCEFHRGAGMVGVITVTGVALATPTPTTSPATTTPSPTTNPPPAIATATTGPAGVTQAPPAPTAVVLSPGTNPFPSTLPATGDPGPLAWSLWTAGLVILAGVVARTVTRR